MDCACVYKYIHAGLLVQYEHPFWDKNTTNCLGFGLFLLLLYWADILGAHFPLLRSQSDVERRSEVCPDGYIKWN